MNGNWSEWSSWSQCDVPCGNGQRSRSRKCIDPAPDIGGEQCSMENDMKGLVEYKVEECKTGIQCTRKSTDVTLVVKVI